MYLVCLPVANTLFVSLFLTSTSRNAIFLPTFLVTASTSMLSPSLAADKYLKLWI